MGMGMRIFVTGATGVLGRRVIRQLIDAGHVVTGNARSAMKAALLRQLGARSVHVDLFDPAALRAAIVGHDVVVNLASAIPPLEKGLARAAWRANDKLRREGTAALVTAALEANAVRFIQPSITAAYADGGDAWIDEQHPLKPARAMASAGAAEERAASFAAGGGQAVVLRFAALVAPESGHAQAIRRYLEWRLAPLPGKPEGFVSWVHADDAAAAVVSALAAPAGVYNVVEDAPLRRRELLNALAAAEGCLPPRLPPAPLLALAGDTVRALMRSQRVSNWKLKSATGWAPRYRCAVQGWRAAPLPRSERSDVPASGVQRVRAATTRRNVDAQP